MPPPKVFTSTRVARLASLVPAPLLAATERAARLGQGKGWGTATISAEVVACLSLLPPHAKNPVVFDIGANVGDWTAEFESQAPSSQIWAFEPADPPFDELFRRFVNSRSVHVVQSAMGSAVGEADLWFDQPGSGLASLSRRRLDHIGVDFASSKRVAVTTVDSFCGTHKVVPDVIKIDVEGHEMDVLAGSRESLKSTSVVQFEFGGTNIDTRTFVQDFFYFFRDIGFRLHRLSPRGLRAVISYSESDEAFEATNFFAVRIRK